MREESNMENREPRLTSTFYIKGSKNKPLCMESGPRSLINTVLEGGGPGGKQLVMDLIQEML